MSQLSQWAQISFPAPDTDYFSAQRVIDGHVYCFGTQLFASTNDVLAPGSNGWLVGGFAADMLVRINARIMYATGTPVGNNLSFSVRVGGYVPGGGPVQPFVITNMDNTSPSVAGSFRTNDVANVNLTLEQIFDLDTPITILVPAGKFFSVILTEYAGQALQAAASFTAILDDMGV